MKEVTRNKLHNSRTIYKVSFHTKRGLYEVRILLHKKGHLYYFKTRDGEIMELVKMKEGFYKCNYYDVLPKDEKAPGKIFLQVRNSCTGDIRLQLRENNIEGEILRNIDLKKEIEKYTEVKENV